MRPHGDAAGAGSNCRLDVVGTSFPPSAASSGPDCDFIADDAWLDNFRLRMFIGGGESVDSRDHSLAELEPDAERAVSGYPA